MLNSVREPLAAVALATFAIACASASGSGFVDGEDAGGGNANGDPTGNSGSLGGEDGAPQGGQTGSATAAVVYAHTDTDLYSMDPTTHVVTEIGPFKVKGSAPKSAVTDLAVDGNGGVWVNTETEIYKATLPATTGSVALTLQTTVSGTQGKFYALAFAPAGVLGSGEGLVGGDSNGELWYIDSSSASAVPVDLGGFGSSANGDAWELSGDLVFYTQNGAPTGIATIRTCSAKQSCGYANDSLAAIDMTALAQAFATKTPGNLLKGTYGSGTGYGELFGLGAWGNKAYGFAREQSGTPAQLIEIDGTTGAGTSIQSFPSITSGWSGAGVTTKAVISVPAPAS